MSNEIKVGDKVRVREDAPKILRKIIPLKVFDEYSEVIAQDDEMAVLWTEPIHKNLIPLKYLVKVEEEAKEAKFKKGDKVRYIGDIQEHKGEMFVIDGDIFFNDYYKQWQASSIKTTPTEVWGICNVPLSDLEPDTAPAAPTIKVGDRVRNIESGLIGVVDKIVYGNIAWVNGVDGKRYHWKSDELELVEPTEQTEAEKDARIRQMEAELGELRKAELDRILHTEKPTFEVTIDNVAMNWQRYEADLAKELALKVANKYNDPKEAAEYAVTVAKAVVEGLKRK